jgi:hypothetical protein
MAKAIARRECGGRASVASFIVHEHSRQRRNEQMPKARASKRKKTNPGVGIDFKKAKHKVGKKLPRAQVGR